MNRQQQLESVFDALVDLVLRMSDEKNDDCYAPEVIPAIVEQIIHLQPLVPKERDFAIRLEGTELARLGEIITDSEGTDKKVNPKVLYRGEVERVTAYVKKLKATVDPVSNDLRETVKNINELMLIEDLALQVIRLITENNLTVKQVNVLLECVQVEVKECYLSY